MKTVFLDWQSLDRDDLDPAPLHREADEFIAYPQTDTGQLAEHIRGADIVISNKVVLDRSLLEQNPQIHLICIAATGSNNVDLQAARELGMAVCNVRAYATASVVQHVFSVIIALSNHLLDYQKAVARGDWGRSEQFCLLDYPIREIAGKTLGIVGYGELGQAVARMAEAFGMQVLLARRDQVDQRSGRIDLAELLPQVDVLSLHCPLTVENQHLIAAKQLALMKRDALLINTARGGLVDEMALADSLRRGELAGAAIDVLSQEPPTEGNPLLADDIPNLIVTPHIAWASRESRQRMVEQLAENIHAYIQGETKNRLV